MSADRVLIEVVKALVHDLETVGIPLPSLPAKLVELDEALEADHRYWQGEIDALKAERLQRATAREKQRRS